MHAKRLRWGILGAARIALRAVIPAIQQSTNGVVTAIASRDAPTAQAAAQNLGIPHAFDSYAALLDSPNVDAVYIPLPNHLHRTWTIRAAECGKHILCEKPFALNVHETDEMIAAAQQSRVVLMEAFMYQFHPQFARVRQLVADGAIGAVRTIRSAFCFTVARPDDIRLKREMGGGALMDVGCYCVNMPRLLIGAEPTQVRAHATPHANRQVDEAFFGILDFPGNVQAVFDCNLRADYTEWLQIQGTAGRLEVPRPIKPMDKPAEIILRRGERPDALATLTSITIPPANHYQLMAEHFADAVLNGAPLAYPPAAGRANMRVLDALVQAAATGCAVTL